MELSDRRQLSNKVLLMGGLILIRLPRVLDLENNPWIILLTLAPFWFVIINNHFACLQNGKRQLKGFVSGLMQLLLLFNITGLAILVSTVFVKAFIEQQSIIYTVLFVVIFVGFSIGSWLGLKAIFSRMKFDSAIAVFGTGYFLLTIISMLRASVLNPFLLLFVYQLITYIIFALSAKFALRIKTNKFLIFLIIGLLLYFILNIVLSWFGIVNTSENYLRQYDAVMLSIVGIDISRRYFPLADGINAFGMVAGAGISFCTALGIATFKNKSKDWIMIASAGFGLFICGYVVMLTDSRGALIFGLLSAGLLVLLPYLENKIFIAAVISIQPLVLIVSPDFLKHIPFISRIARNGTDVLSGRSEIWTYAIDHLSAAKPIHSVGYGLFGQTVSGVVESYRHLFKSYLHTDLIDLHNYFLQSIFDTGYLGLLVALTIFYLMGISLMRKIVKYSDNVEFPLAFSGLLYFILIGSVSTIPAFYSRELFYLFPFIWVTAGIRNEKDND